MTSTSTTTTTLADLASQLAEAREITANLETQIESLGEIQFNLMKEAFFEIFPCLQDKNIKSKYTGDYFRPKAFEWLKYTDYLEISEYSNNILTSIDCWQRPHADYGWERLHSFDLHPDIADPSAHSAIKQEYLNQFQATRDLLDGRIKEHNLKEAEKLRQQLAKLEAQA